jgi:predicted ATP-grasp superfamily ATP-dependent carboligase
MLLEIITPIIMSLSGPSCTYIATPTNQTTIKTVGDRDVTFGVKEEVEEILSNKGIVLCDSGDVKIDVAITKIESPQEIVNIMGIQWLKKDYIIETEIVKEGKTYKGTGVKKTFVFAMFLNVEGGEVPLNKKAFSKALQSSLKSASKSL